MLFYLLYFGLWIVAIYVYVSNVENPPAKNGVYSRPGPMYPLKFIIFYLMVALRQIRTKKPDDNELEKPLQFSTSVHAFDAVFFSGVTSNGTYVVIATERRPNNLTFGIVYLLIPGKGLWKGSWLPNTTLNRDNEETFSGGGIELTPTEAMRSWNVCFNGNVMSEDDHSDVETVVMDLTWSSDEPLFNYDNQMSAYATARAFAKEPWNEQYFKDLEKAHQTHYEQMGRLNGKIKFGQGETVDIANMPSFRDHSFGHARDWMMMHRYIFHHIFLNDGTKAVVGVVCQPHTCSSLECGFLSQRGGQIFPVDLCDLELANHGEGGNPPKSYGFNFSAGGHEYQVQVVVNAECEHFLGHQMETKNIERFVDYKVNNVPGKGISEWNYSHMWRSNR